MKNEVAVYIGADPLTFNDIDLILRCIQMFGFIHILLDRKNRDAEYDKYYLSYSDRVDIIRHDLKQRKHIDFDILPIDLTVLNAIKEHNINTLVLNLDYLKNTNFKMYSAMKCVLEDINILCLSADDFIGSHFMNTLIDSDSTMTLYKKFCSDYAYSKFKVKTTKKLGLTGNMGCKLECVRDVFKDRGFSVLDLDEYTFGLYKDHNFIDILRTAYSKAGLSALNDFIHNDGNSEYIDKCDILKYNLKHLTATDIFERILYQLIQEQIMKNLIAQYSNTIVIKFVLIYEYAMEKLFDKIIAVNCDKDVLVKNLIDEGYSISQVNDFFELELSIEEKCEYADYVLNANKTDVELKNSCLVMINSKLRQFQC